MRAPKSQGTAFFWIKAKDSFNPFFFLTLRFAGIVKNKFCFNPKIILDFFSDGKRNLLLTQLYSWERAQPFVNKETCADSKLHGNPFVSMTPSRLFLHPSARIYVSLGRVTPVQGQILCCTVEDTVAVLLLFYLAAHSAGKRAITRIPLCTAAVLDF